MFSGFGGFGGSTAPAFGQPSFGAQASAPAFGAPSSTPASAFGASSGFGAPAFGAPSAPAFGAPSSAPAFGSSVFGAPSAPAFGAAASAPAFGAAAPAFGASPPASSPFGGTGLFGGAGASTGPAFGGAGASTGPSGFGAFGAPRPAFGAASPASPFGTPAPAGSTGLFGTPAASPAPFGAAAPAAGAAAGQGSRVVPFAKTVDRDGTGGAGQTNMANYMSISAMPQYINKSVEELRFEDYAANCKSGAAAPAPAFGQPSAASNPFGAAPASPAPFGGGSLFGSSAPASSPFGLSGSAPAFGASAPAASSPFGGGSSLFGAPASSAPAFGTPASAPAFGGGGAFGTPASSAPAFGSGAPAFGTPGASSPFGASTGGGLFGSAPAFGSQAPTSSPAPFSFGSAPAFGAQQPASTSAPAFGAAPSLFGTPAPASGGGLFGASTAPASNPFGAASSPPPAFGASSSTFGAFGSAFAKPGGASSPFGATTGSSLFGASAAPPAFGASAPAFGGGFGGFGGFGASAPAASSASAFGGSSPSLFGGTTGSSIFGSSAPSLFGGSAPSFSTGGLFGGGTAGALGSQPAGLQMGLQPQVQAPNVAAAPYGSFPALPTVPEPKVGISARPARTIQATGTSHASPLLSLRGLSAPKLGVQVRTSQASPLGSTMFGGPLRSAPLARPGTDGGAATTPQPPAPLPVRPNPHRLFIREPPPGTEPATSPPASVGPSAAAAHVPPSTPIATTPLPRSPEAPSLAATATGIAHAGLMSPSSPAAATATDASGRCREPPLVNGAGQAPVLTEFVREATPAEDGVGAAVRELLPTLGRLAAEGYTYEPSPMQLAAMHTLDPRSLHKVHNFTVARAGFGAIRWLRPVDVVGLKLDGIVTIQQGEVFCYSDADKPPLGQGLNCDAEITLLGVYKVDRATGTPVRDGPLLVKWEKSLRLMCLRMGAKFVSYKPDGGVWRFEVEHFSRYGLLPEVEAELEEATAAAAAAAARDPNVAGPGFGGTPASRVLHPAPTPSRGMDKQARFGSIAELMEADDEDDEGVVSLVVRRRGAEQEEAQGPHAADGYVRGGTPLQHGLPASLNLSPTSLLALRDSFGTSAGASHARGGTPAGGAYYGAAALSPTSDAQLALPNKRAKPTLLTEAGTAEAGVAAAAGGRAAPRALAMGAAGAGEGAALVAHSWRRSAAPLARPALHPSSSPSQQGALALVEGAVGAEGRVVPRGLGVVREPEEEVAVGREGRGLADSGRVMACSFRASWGPGGMLVMPGRGVITGSGTSHPVTLLRISTTSAGDAHAQPHAPAAPPPLSRPDPLGLQTRPEQRPRTQTDARAAATEDAEGDAAMAAAEGSLPEGAPEGGPAALQRARLAALLDVHLQHSAPVGGRAAAPAAAAAAAAAGSGSMAAARIEEAAEQEGPEGGATGDVPRWQLRCTRDSLGDFVGALTRALQCSLVLPRAEGKERDLEQAQQQEAWLEAEAVRVVYEMDTWQLLQVLFARLHPSMAPGILGGPAAGTSMLRTPSRGRSIQGDDDEMSEAAPTPLGLGDGPRLHRSTSAMIRASGGASFLRRSAAGGGSDGGGTPSHLPDEASAPLLIAALRQGALSRWLQQQAAPRAMAALEQQAGAEGQRSMLEPALHAVLQLLSARQLGAAAAVAAACGDIALSTLVAGAPTHAACQAEIAEQLRVWRASGVLGHVAKGRLLVYQLLAGQVSEVSANLGLDWRRHLGLLLWFHIRTTAAPPGPNPRACPTSTPAAAAGTSAGLMLLPHQRAPATAAVDALRMYATSLMTQAHSSAAGGGQAAEAATPWPYPMYMEEQQQGRTPAHANAHAPQDLQYVLLQLWRAHSEACAEAEAEARAQAGGSSSVAAAGGMQLMAGQEAVPELLVASSHSAHPCDCALPWMLSTALQGLGVVRGGAQPQSQGGQLSAHAAELLLASHMDLILQVQQAGGMPEWAVYIAMNLPDSSPTWQAAGHQPGPRSLRWHVVRELLMRSAPEWAGDGAKEAFLCDTLGVPTALVAEAVAIWAQHQGDFHTACTALMAAGQWQQAHDTLVQHVAPSLMLSQKYSRLQGLLVSMTPHAPQLPDWRTGGGLYLHYLNTMSALAPHATTKPLAQPQARQQLQDRLLQLAQALADASAAVAMHAHTQPHAASVAVGGGEAVAGVLSPHALQQRVVLGAMAGRVKFALLREAHHHHHHQVGVCARGIGNAGIADALCSVLGLGNIEHGPAYGQVGAVTWHVGAAIA